MPPWTPTRTATPSRCCSRTAGGPPRTPPAYLLPVAAARARPARRRLRARARSPSTSPPAWRRAGCVGLDVSADPLAEARAAAERAGVAVTFEVGDVYALGGGRRLLRRRPRPPGAAAPDRPGRRAARDGPGLPAGRGDRRPGRRLRARSPGSPPTTAWTAGWTSTTRVARRNGARAGRRPAAAVVGARGGAARRRRHHVVLVLRLAGRAASGGATRGPAGRRRRPSPSRPSPTGWRRPAELEEIAAAWLRWRDADDGWLGMLHGELLIRDLTAGDQIVRSAPARSCRQHGRRPSISPGGRRWPGRRCSRTAPGRARSPRSAR